MLEHIIFDATGLNLIKFTLFLCFLYIIDESNIIFLFSSFIFIIYTDLFSLPKDKILFSKGENSISRILLFSIKDIEELVDKFTGILLDLTIFNSPLDFHAIAKYFSFIDINRPSVDVLDKLQFVKALISFPARFFDF